MDEEFPLGDGTADTEATIVCPCCGQTVEVVLDPGGGAAQVYVEDCAVCCQPWQVFVRYGSEGGAEVSVLPLDS